MSAQNNAPSVKHQPSTSPSHDAGDNDSSSAHTDSDIISALNRMRCPLFLSKTFAMLSSCPADIATWAEDGLSFYVMDRNRLAETIIPQYFNHNKFSSFVRQLNFYGFRKVWSERATQLVSIYM